MLTGLAEQVVLAGIKLIVAHLHDVALKKISTPLQ